MTSVLKNRSKHKYNSKIPQIYSTFNSFLSTHTDRWKAHMLPYAHPLAFTESSSLQKTYLMTRFNCTPVTWRNDKPSHVACLKVFSWTITTHLAAHITSHLFPGQSVVQNKEPASWRSRTDRTSLENKHTFTYETKISSKTIPRSRTSDSNRTSNHLVPPPPFPLNILHTSFPCR